MAKKKDRIDDLAIKLQTFIRNVSLANAEPVKMVMETLDALNFETRAGLRPVLVHKKKTALGWHLVLNLPAGIAAQDVIAKQNHFEEQAGAKITITNHGSTLHMSLVTAVVPKKAPYNWNHVDYPNMDLPIPIGYTPLGLKVVDLAEVLSILIGGLPGKGKTNFLRALAVSLIPQNTCVTIIDPKSLDYNFLANHALVATDPGEASQVIVGLNKEMDRRRVLLKAAGATKLQEFNGDLPWVVAIVDEMSEIDDKDDQKLINRLMRMGRAAGICVVAATQRPSHTTWDKFTDTRALFAGRLSFAFVKPEDSRMVLDSDAGSHIPMDQIGRAVWSWDEEVELQTMYLPPEEATRIIKQTRAREVTIIEPHIARLPAR